MTRVSWRKRKKDAKIEKKIRKMRVKYNFRNMVYHMGTEMETG